MDTHLLAERSPYHHNFMRMNRSAGTAFANTNLRARDGGGDLGESFLGMSSHAVGSEKIAGGAAGQRPLGGEQGQGAVGGRRRKERQARRNHEILGDKTKKLQLIGNRIGRILE